MRKSYLLGSVLGMVCLLTASVGAAATVTIADVNGNSGVYWGGQGVGGNNYYTSQDILGTEADYEISGMDVQTSANSMDFKIHSRFFDNINQVGASEGNNDYVVMGDLFLSNNGWQPNTDASVVPSVSADHSSYDNSQNGEAWEYALVLGSYDGSQTSGTLSMFNVVESNILYVDDLHVNYFGQRRWGQEVQYTGANQNEISGLTGTWYIDYGIAGTDTDDFLSLHMEWLGQGDSFADMGMVNDIGVHWTMSCGNDVIEGGDPVPEPATMLLMGIGLAGLVGRRVRSRMS